MGHDEGLRKAIRRRLAGGGPDAAGTPRRTRRAAPAKTLKTLNDERDKLLGLYYAEKISEDGFHREETRIATAIEAVRQQMVLEGDEERLKSELEVRFEEVARILADLDMDAVWAEATNANVASWSRISSSASRCFPITWKSKWSAVRRSTSCSPRLDSRYRRMLVSEGRREPARHELPPIAAISSD